MKKNIITAVILLISFAQIIAQNTAPLRGKVTTVDGEPMIGATVIWQGTQIGAVADTAGRFSIQRMADTANLVIRFVGLDDLIMEIFPDEQDVWIELRDLPPAVLQEVQVTARKFGNSVSVLGNHNVESISSSELRKAPCCNLSESFETNNTVDVAYPNAITGVREVQMLGLRSAYTLFLTENRQGMKGIAAPYAFEFIPGTWLSGVQIAKGAGTVVNGSEGIAGQISIELQRPDRDKPVFVNAYANSGNRVEGNLHLNRKGKGHFSHGVMLHGSQQRSPFDHNDDNFYDMLSRDQLNGMYRMIYESPKWCGQLTSQALTDQRTGGQIAPDASGQRFAFGIDNQRFELTGKLGRTGLGGRPYKELGNIAHVAKHTTRGTIGAHKYDAQQQSVMLQSIYKTIISNTNHSLVVAGNLNADLLTEKLDELTFDRKEYVAGAMAEYTWQRPDLENHGLTDLAFVLGLRTDYNSLFGVLVSPRASARYNPSQATVWRASVGKGFHAPFIISENLSWLATNKALDFAKVTHAESAWNYGLNVVHKMQIGGRTASISFDAYRTDFERQLLIDQETRPDTLSVYYSTGKSWAQTAMAMFQINIAKGLDIKLATKVQDVQATYRDGVLRRAPMLPMHRHLVSLDYTTRDERWMLTATMHVVGTQRLPKNEGNPHVHGDFPERTPVYPTFQAQLTRKWKRIEVYVGGENLSSYTQHRQIISADDPTSKFFNASQVWAPAFGRMGFVGLRVTPKG
jgi:outer membrane receptor for ferrienterochelin and colicins